MLQSTRKTMTNNQHSFQKIQYQFAGNIRNPDDIEIPDHIESRRMKIYQDLFYNNIEGFVSSAFPVVRTLFDDVLWHQMIRDFMIEHRCQSPLFAEISMEFLDYLSSNRKDLLQKYPFLLELAHYEWVEIAVVYGDENATITEQSIDWIKQKPVLSSICHVLAYEYPVHLISTDFIPNESQKQPTFLVVYRDHQDEIHFMEINAVSYRLLSMMDGVTTGESLLADIATELQNPEPESLYPMAIELMDSFHDKNILLGTVL